MTATAHRPLPAVTLMPAFRAAVGPTGILGKDRQGLPVAADALPITGDVAGGRGGCGRFEGVHAPGQGAHLLGNGEQFGAAGGDQGRPVQDGPVERDAGIPHARALERVPGLPARPGATKEE